MIKQMQRALLLFAAMLMITTAFAQEMQMPPIPVDTAVRIGRLPSGLTYYIRHNEKPKGQADFYIAQKVGSILEEESQRGLAHFLEHMCFNGTDHFPGTMLRDWLETKGVRFGENLNAYTGVDQTVYNISNVPVDNPAVQDSCLLILHDWATAVTLDPEEIDKERGVIHQEWRRSMVGTMRILENVLPTMYPDCRYGYRLPIGIMEVVDNFPPQDLRDYYETWYRPDQQGIIVVGDIDVDYIEGKIKEIFADLEMPANPKERVYFEVPDTPGTIYAIGSDPEQTTGIFDIMFKCDATKPEDKGTIDYLMENYIWNMVDAMLSQRLHDIVQSADSPFTSASAGYGDYFLAQTENCVEIEGVVKGNDMLPAFETAYRELLRALRGGFTVGEYERARAEYLSRLERIYNSRDSRQSGAYVQEYVNHFLQNEPIPSIEDEYQLMTLIANNLPVDVINMALPQTITEDNRVVLVLAPQNDTFQVPTEEQLAAIIARVDAEDIEPYRDQMKEEPLIPELPTPGTVVSTKEDAQFGAQILTLSNGVRVIVKPTDFKKDQILFAAVALGGTSSIGDSEAVNLMMLDDAMDNSGLGDYTALDIKKYLQGKQVGVSLGLGNYNRRLSGSSTAKDLPTMMELIYMNFMGYNITEEEFATTQAQLLSQLENAESNPQFVWIKSVLNAIYKSPANHQATKDDVMAASREGILEIVHNSVANAADYTFVFVGDIDMDTFVPLVEQYIATLPADAKKATKKYKYNPARELAKGKINVTNTMKMETPQTWVYIIVSGNVPYSVKNTLIADAAAEILSNRLLKKIREEMGAVYSIGASGDLSSLSKNNASIQIPFPMKPELKDEVLSEIDIMLNDMVNNISEEELAPIKEYMIKNAKEDLEENGSWLSAIVNNIYTGADNLNGREDVINSITTQDIMNYVKKLLKQGNYSVVVLDPEAE